MSRTPHRELTGGQAADYLEAWKAITRWSHQGRSWSGFERNCCFLNTGQTRFADISAVSGLDLKDDERGLAIVDWDHDGDLDLWVSNRIAPRVRFLRNDLSLETDFIALRLEGRDCNRDAIGARVELVPTAGNRPPKLSRTLHAGEGFLSQSSKWLHFGLGVASHQNAMYDAIVHWPQGEPERFPQLSKNQHYDLRQGTSAASPWRRPEPASAVQPSQPKLPPRASRVVHRLVAPYDLNPLQYLDWNRNPQPVSTLNSQTVLLNLWASWCSPCLEELKQFQDRKAELDAAGVQVIALSVDGLGDDTDEPIDNKALRRLARGLTGGRASRELLTELQTAHDDLLSTHKPLPLPCSFLFNTVGELTVIYKGPLEVDDLLKDSMRTDEDAGEPRRFLPFPGRWHNPPRGIRLQQYLGRARALAAEQQLDQAIAAYRRAIDHDPRNVLPRYELARLLSDFNRRREAIEELSELTRQGPISTPSLMLLADLLLQERRYSEAAKHYATVIRVSPESAEAHDKLGVVMVANHKLADAERLFRQATVLAPENTAYRNNLGHVLEQQGRYREAIVQLRVALEGPQPSTSAAGHLAWILATCEDRSLRNGLEAVKLAQECVDATQGKDAQMRFRLAAAYAEAGRRNESQRAAQAAISIAKRNSQLRLAGQIQSWLEMQAAAE